MGIYWKIFSSSAGLLKFLIFLFLNPNNVAYTANESNATIWFQDHSRIKNFIVKKIIKSLKWLEINYSSWIIKKEY